MATAFAAPAAPAQQAGPPPKAPADNAGDVLSGQLMVMRVRAGNDGQARSDLSDHQRAAPAAPPSGCATRTGPERSSSSPPADAQAAELKTFAGKEVSVKVGEIACAQTAGQMSEAVVTNGAW